MKRIGICGHYGGKKNCLDGQTIKTKIVTSILEEELGVDEILKIDTYGGVKRLPVILLGLFRLLIKCDNIIILPAHKSLRVFAPLLAFCNLFCRKSLHYIVIGGWLIKIIEHRWWLKLALKSFDVIYVETSTMKTMLVNKGFTNVVVMPNCKDLTILTKSQLIYSVQCPFKLCTLSRVMEEKGIEDAIRAVKYINEKYNRIIYTLDIYGQVSDSYIERFKILQKEFPSYIKYGGVVPFDQTVNILKDYFALLFPTHFYTEGVPGTIIDAYAAGIPIISSKWQNFSDVVDNNIVGIGYKFNDYEQFKSILIDVMNNPERLNSMKSSCLKKASEFTSNRVILDILYPNLR